VGWLAATDLAVVAVAVLEAVPAVVVPAVARGVAVVRVRIGRSRFPVKWVAVELAARIVR